MTTNQNDYVINHQQNLNQKCRNKAQEYISSWIKESAVTLHTTQTSNGLMPYAKIQKPTLKVQKLQNSKIIQNKD